MNDSDKATLAQYSSHAVMAPAGAKICTLDKDALEIMVNCAGFKRRFKTIQLAASFLDLPWDELEHIMIEQGLPTILIRHHAKEPWRSPSKAVLGDDSN